VGLSAARVLLYEPNAYPGLLNRRLGRLADRVGVAFEEAGRWFDMKRLAVVGYPVRRELLQPDRAVARQRLGIGPDQQVVFIFGGSGGARAINEAVVEALPELRRHPGLLVLHVTGRQVGPDYDAVRDTERALKESGLEGDTQAWYRRFDYLDDIQTAYAAADLVVCRGGASTLTEVGICGLPSVIVPLPSAAEDHQAVNARELQRRGAARVLYQRASWRDGRVASRLDGARLAHEIVSLLADDGARQAMGQAARDVPLPNSLELILAEAEGLIAGRRPAPLSLSYPAARANGLPDDPNALWRAVQRRVLEVGGPSSLDAAELACLRAQTDRFLTSEVWYEIPLGRRNVGVKLVGCLGYHEHLPLLLGILGDRHRVGVARRLFGGDYVHGGLLRRNVIELGIIPLGVTSEAGRQALLQALAQDPYFEVRRAAARALGELFDPEAQLQLAVAAALDDRSPAVVEQAIKALGRLAVDSGVMPLFQRFYLHPDWRFRLSVAEALVGLASRGIIEPGWAAAQRDQILSTSPYFQPRFPLEEALRHLSAVRETAPGRSTAELGPRRTG
jgi:UDP-N-acetylglucosamine--N-acetylmuramyl-(pentapeptide) pyrophosphoryl-undecaprenol N-acetylglucosamine transferase